MFVKFMFFSLIAINTAVRFAPKNCNNFPVLMKCQFSLAKTRIHLSSRVTHSGISQSECEINMIRFHWSVGIFCPLSLFCGMGMELTGDYHPTDLSYHEQTPVKELCNFWVRADMTNCDELYVAIYDAGILRGRQKKWWKVIINRDKLKYDHAFWEITEI